MIYIPNSDEIKKYIKDNYPEGDLEVMSKYLGKSKYNIIKTANSLGVIRKRNWSDKETKKLRNLYLETELPVETIANMLGRTLKSVQGKIRFEGMHRYGDTQVWTPSEIQYLKDNFANKTRYRVSAEMNRTPAAISRYASILHLKARKFKIKTFVKSSRWTIWEEQFLLDHYDILPTTKIARALLKSRKSIESKMKRMGLLSKRLKIYKGTTFIFMYLDEEDKIRKKEYIMWWRDNIYGEHYELKKTARKFETEFNYQENKQRNA